ncbi:hypothetical protein BPS1E_1902 [Bifidobacterium pseudocatenulatum]|uniref:Uncharacterized protein n=2 Tax=Bifidobacterium pseudocatenulatum TaxID=28026 RepID=A0A267WJ36_BIFPS|nr:hypothetical protein [Bifidobacterium pseudocatenulatum]PAC72616.1 hypothetical protein BPS1E_1902 [Bifidobacterium pseudocatenulatum]
MAATNVHFSFKDAQGHPKAGTLHFAPVRRHISGSTVVVQGGFDVTLGSDGTATVQLEPTDNTFAWKVSEFPDDTNSSFERVVQVPASTSTIEYTSLVDVDASTLAPALNSGAALTYLLASSLQEAQTMSAANPGQMVFYPEGQAKTVASQILEDLTGARAVVEAQSAVAAQAANAAQAASDASQAASAQVTAVADSITESKTVVESHANEALTAIDEAVKSVQDKASDVSGEDGTDTMPTDSTDSASSQEA